MADSDEGEIDFNLEGMGFTVLDECEEEEGFDLGSEDELGGIVVLDELEDSAETTNETDKSEEMKQSSKSSRVEKKDSNREKRSLSKCSDRSQHRSTRAIDSRYQSHTHRSRDSRRSRSPKRHTSSSRHSSSKDHHRSSNRDRKDKSRSSRRSHERSQSRHVSSRHGSKSKSGYRPRDTKKTQHDKKQSESDDEDMKITVFEFPEDNDVKNIDTTELVSVDLYEAGKEGGSSSPQKPATSSEGASVQNEDVSKDKPSNETPKEKISIAVSEKPAAELLMEDTQSNNCKQQQPTPSKKVELILKKLPKSVEKELEEKGHVVDKEGNNTVSTGKDSCDSSEKSSKESPAVKPVSDGTQSISQDSSVEKDNSNSNRTISKEISVVENNSESSEVLSKDAQAEKDSSDSIQSKDASSDKDIDKVASKIDLSPSTDTLTDLDKAPDEAPDSPEVICWEETPEVIEVSDDDIEEFYMQADADTELVTEVKKEDLSSETEKNEDAEEINTSLMDTLDSTTESNVEVAEAVEALDEPSTLSEDLHSSANIEQTLLAKEVNSSATEAQESPSVEQPSETVEDDKNDDAVVCISEDSVSVVHVNAEQSHLSTKADILAGIPDAVVVTSSREDEINQPKDAGHKKSSDTVREGANKRGERVIGIENFNEKVMSENEESKTTEVEWCEVIDSDEDEEEDIQITAVDEVDVSVGNAASTADLVTVDVDQEGEEDEMQINADDMLEDQMITNRENSEELSLEKEVVDEEEMDLVELDNLEEDEQEEDEDNTNVEDCGEIDEDAFKAMLELEGLVDLDDIQDDEKSDLEEDNEGEGFDIGSDEELEEGNNEDDDVVVIGVEEGVPHGKATPKATDKSTKPTSAKSSKKTSVDVKKQVQQTDSDKVDTELQDVEEICSSEDEQSFHHEAFSDDEQPVAVEDVSFEYGDDVELVDIDTLDDAGIDHKLRAKAERIKIKRKFKDWEVPDFNEEHTEALLSSLKVPVKLSKFRLAELLNESGLKLLDQVGTFSAQIYKGDGLVFGDLTIRDFNPDVMINTFAGFLQKTKEADLDASQTFKFLTENRIMEYGRSRLKKRKVADQREHGVVVKGVIMIHSLPSNVTDIALKRIFPGCEKIVMPKDYRGEDTSLALVIYDNQTQVKHILQSKFQIKKRIIVHYDEICTMTSKEKWGEHFEKSSTKSQSDKKEENKDKTKSDSKTEDPLEAQLMKDVQLQLKLLKEQSGKQDEHSKKQKEQPKHQDGSAPRTINVMSSGMTVTIAGGDKNTDKETLMPPPTDTSAKGVPAFKITKTSTKRKSMEDYEKMRSPLSNLDKTQTNKGRGRTRQASARDGKEAQRGREANDDRRKEVQDGRNEVKSGRDSSKGGDKGKEGSDRALRSDERSRSKDSGSSERSSRSSDRKTRSSDRNSSRSERENSSERNRRSRERTERRSKWDGGEMDDSMVIDLEASGTGRQILVEMPGSGGQIMEIGATPELVVQSVTCVPIDAVDNMPIPELPEGMQIPEGGLIVEREISFSNQPAGTPEDVFTGNQFKDDFRNPRVPAQSVQAPIMSSSVALQGPPGMGPPSQVVLPGQHVLQQGTNVIVPTSIAIQALTSVPPPQIQMAPFSASAPVRLTVQNPLVPVQQQVLQHQITNQPGNQAFGVGTNPVPASVNVSLVSGQPVVMTIPPTGQNVQGSMPVVTSSVSTVQTLRSGSRPQQTKAPASTRVLVPIAKQSTITTAPSSAAIVKTQVNPTVTVRASNQVTVSVTQSTPSIRAAVPVSQPQPVQPVLQTRQLLQQQQATLQQKQVILQQQQHLQQPRQPVQAQQIRQQQPRQTLQTQQPLQGVQQQTRQPFQQQQRHLLQQQARQPLQQQTRQPLQQQQTRQPLQQQTRQPLQQQSIQPLQQQTRQPLQQQTRQPLQQQQIRQPLQQQPRQPLQQQQPRLSMTQQDHLKQKIMPLPTSQAHTPSTTSVQTKTTSAAHQMSAVALQSSQLRNIKKAIIEQKKKLKETLKEQQKSGLHATPDFQSQPVKYVAPVCLSSTPSTSSIVTTQPSQTTQSSQNAPGNTNLLSLPITNTPSVGQPIEVIQSKDQIRQKIDAAKWSKELKDREEKAKAEKERIQREKEAKDRLLKEKAEKDRIQREKEQKEREEREKKRREREEKARQEEKIRLEKERKEKIESEKKEKMERERKMLERQERERRNREELLKAERQREERRRKMEAEKRKKESSVSNTGGISPQTLYYLQQQKKRKTSCGARSRSRSSDSDMSSITSSSSDSDSMRDIEDSEKTLRKSRKMRMMIEKMDYAEEKRRLRKEREKLAKQEERLRKLVEASALAGGQYDTEENSLISLLTTALEAAKKKVANASNTKKPATAQKNTTKAGGQSDHDSADMSMSDEEKGKTSGDMVIDYGHKSMSTNTAAPGQTFPNRSASSTAVAPPSYTDSQLHQPQVTDYANRPATTIAREWSKRASSSMYNRGQTATGVGRGPWDTQPGYSAQQNYPAKGGMGQPSSVDSDPLTALLKSSLNTVQEHISEMRNPQKVPSAAELQDILNKVKEVAGNMSTQPYGGGQTMMSAQGRGLPHPAEQRLGNASGPFLMGVEASTVQKQPEIIEYGHSRPEWEKYKASPMKAKVSDRFGLDYYMGNVFDKGGAMKSQQKQKIGEAGDDMHWGYTNFDYHVTDVDRHKIPQETPRLYRDPNKAKEIPCLLDIEVTKKGIDYTQWSTDFEETIKTKEAQKRPAAQNEGPKDAKKGKLDHQGQGNYTRKGNVMGKGNMTGKSNTSGKGYMMGIMRKGSNTKGKGNMMGTGSDITGKGNMMGTAHPSTTVELTLEERISKQRKRNAELQKVNSIGEFLKNLGGDGDQQSVDFSDEDTSSRAERKLLMSKYPLIPGLNNEPLQFEGKMDTSRTVVRNEFSLMRNKPNQTLQGSDTQGKLGSSGIPGASQKATVSNKSYQSWDNSANVQGQGQPAAENVTRSQQNFNRPGMKPQGQGHNRPGVKQQGQGQNQPLQMQQGGYAYAGFQQQQTSLQQRQNQGPNQSILSSQQRPGQGQSQEQNTLDWFRATKSMHLQKSAQQKPLKSILKSGGKPLTKGGSAVQSDQIQPGKGGSAVQSDQIQPGKWGQAPLAFDYLHSADPHSNLVHYEDSD